MNNRLHTGLIKIEFVFFLFKRVAALRGIWAIRFSIAREDLVRPNPPRYFRTSKKLSLCVSSDSVSKKKPMLYRAWNYHSFPSFISHYTRKRYRR